MDISFEFDRYLQIEFECIKDKNKILKFLNKATNNNKKVRKAKRKLIEINVFLFKHGI